MTRLMYVHIYICLHLFMSLFVPLLVSMRLLMVDSAVSNPPESGLAFCSGHSFPWFAAELWVLLFPGWFRSVSDAI